ncbi:Fanconi-associated nuclease 1 [Physocladia obscura]|uniref:Fanconi-associated nuclease n=1 Tax=Physocladia obscura TaxID=109957 RepID=A0AAD5T1K6_9FUNG|nr:Fanconi-associated nuclease 1 [Physocladia obscura]
MKNHDIRSFFGRPEQKDYERNCGPHSNNFESSESTEEAGSKIRNAQIRQDDKDEVEETDELNDHTKLLSYGQQWRAVIDAVRLDESHLLDAQDKAILSSFVSLLNSEPVLSEHKQLVVTERGDGHEHKNEHNQQEDKQEEHMHGKQELGTVFIRLMLRTHKVEREERVTASTRAALPSLANINLIDRSVEFSLSLNEMLDLLSRRILLTVAIRCKIKSPSSLSTPKLRSAIGAFADEITSIKPFGKDLKNPFTALVEHIRSLLGPCFFIPSHVVECFHRLFIVYNRETVWPENPFLPHIRTNLRSNAQRLSFNTYAINRVSITWPTRDDLIQYVEMLKVRHEIDSRLSKISASTPQNERNEIEIEVISLGITCVSTFEHWIKNYSNEGHISGIPWLASFTAGMKSASILRIIALLYMKRNMDNEAASLFQKLLDCKMFGLKHKRGDLYDNYMKLLIRNKKTVEAYNLGCKALGDDSVEFGKRHEIETRVIKISSKLPHRQEQIISTSTCLQSLKKIKTRTMYAEKTFSSTGHKALYMCPNTLESVHVETLALHEYANLGFPYGVHSESSVITTLFGLLFWDIIFDDTVLGVFTSPFQAAPLDFATEFFYGARKSSIDARLCEIEDEKCHSDLMNENPKTQEKRHVQIIETVDAMHRENATQCRGVQWNRFSRQDLLQIASCFSGVQIAQICKAFIESYNAHGGGVPDLCVWKPATLPAISATTSTLVGENCELNGNLESGEVCLVEVKGEGDHLSHSQMMWIDLLVRCGVTVELFQVHIDKKKRITGKIQNTSNKREKK